MKYRGAITCILICGSLCNAQDLATIHKQKPLTYNGSLSATTGFYKSRGIKQNRDPYSYVLNAVINFRLFNTLDLPFTGYICKNNHTYTQPSFNQFGASPHYKWLTIHGGYRSMQFSNYTVSGVTFLGGGLDIRPASSPVQFSALYGQYSRARPITDSTAINNIQPTYRRIGYGARITAGNQQNNLSIILFHARDDEHSLDYFSGGSQIAPQENLVTAVGGTIQILNNLSVSGEYSLSALTSNTRLPARMLETYTYANHLGNLYTPNTSSSFSKAIELTLSYTYEDWSAGLSHKRIDPGYRSLGAAYMQSDLADYLLNASKTFFKRKLQCTAHAGMQHNNLDKKLLSTERRLIGSMNLNFALTEQLSVNAGYSNFSTGNEPSTLAISDTLHYAQITSNRDVGVSYSFGSENYKQNVQMNTSLQTANTLNETATEIEKMNTIVINSTAGYTLSLKQSGLMLSPLFSFSQSRVEGQETMTAGPSLNASKWLNKKKMQLTAGFSLLNSYNQQKPSCSMQVVRAGWNWKISKHHSFKLMHALRLRPTAPGNSHAAENTGSFTYQYSL